MLYKILKNKVNFYEAKRNGVLGYLNKKVFSLILLLIIFSPLTIFFTPEISQAEGGFALLENYPGLEKVQEALNLKPGDEGYEDRSSIALGTYVDLIVKFSMGLLSVGAVIMIIVAGIEYIGSETWSKKSNAKDRITRSIGALILMFSAFIFFEQLNPELLKVRFKPITTNDLGIEKTQINSISDIWDDDNFATLSESKNYGWKQTCPTNLQIDTELGDKKVCVDAFDIYKREHGDTLEYKSCEFLNAGMNILSGGNDGQDDWCYEYRPKGMGDSIKKNSNDGYDEVVQISLSEKDCENARKKDNRSSQTPCSCNEDLWKNCFYYRKTFMKIEKERSNFYEEILDESKNKNNFRKNGTTFFGILKQAPWTDEKDCEKARVDDREKEPIGNGCVLFRAEHSGKTVAGWGYFWKEKSKRSKAYASLILCSNYTQSECKEIPIESGKWYFNY